MGIDSSEIVNGIASDEIRFLNGRKRKGVFFVFVLLFEEGDNVGFIRFEAFFVDCGKCPACCAELELSFFEPERNASMSEAVDKLADFLIIH